MARIACSSYLFVFRYHAFLNQARRELHVFALLQICVSSQYRSSFFCLLPDMNKVWRRSYRESEWRQSAFSPGNDRDAQYFVTSWTYSWKRSKCKRYIRQWEIVCFYILRGFCYKSEVGTTAVWTCICEPEQKACESWLHAAEPRDYVIPGFDSYATNDSDKRTINLE